MTDFIISLLITIVITLITIQLDSLVAKMLALSKKSSRFTDLETLIDTEGLTKEEITKKIKETNQSYKNSELQRNIWGSDLAVVAFSLDLAALGIYLTDKNLFPFFSRFNTSNVDRAILVIAFTLLFHFLLFIFSIVAKNKHTEQTSEIILVDVPSIFTKAGFQLSKWKLTTNSVGFITLLSTIVILTNSI